MISGELVCLLISSRTFLPPNVKFWNDTLEADVLTTLTDSGVFFSAAFDLTLATIQTSCLLCIHPLIAAFGLHRAPHERIVGGMQAGEINILTIRGCAEINYRSRLSRSEISPARPD